MHGLPTDEQVPRDVLHSVREQTVEGRERLIAWLFEQFRSKVDPDRLATSLAHLMERMANGFVPDRPVGLLRTMLFQARCDERRRKEVARSFLVDLRRATPLVDPDDAATATERNALLARVSSEVFWRTEATTRAVIWAHVNGATYEEIASNSGADTGGALVCRSGPPLFLRSEAAVARAIPRVTGRRSPGVFF